MKFLTSIAVFLFLSFAFFFVDGFVTVAAEPITMKTVFVDDEQEKPFEAGQLAGRKLLEEMNGGNLELILLAESFEGKENKEKLLEGLCSVLPKEKLFGLSTYGSFIRDSVGDGDRVTLLGIGGDLTVQSALQTELGVARLQMDTAEEEIRAKLLQAGRTLGEKNNTPTKNRFDILLADAHSPKNSFLVRGILEKLGNDAMILGGSANKNPGQNHVYYQGVRYEDAAILLTLSGSFQVAMAGRFANQGDTVVKTAEEATVNAVENVNGTPLGMIAFSCAGRKSKLDELDDELNAIQKQFTDKTIFGCFCAGEVGPADPAVEKIDAKCCGSGWCLMLAVLFHPNDQAKEADQNTQSLVKYYETMNEPKPLLVRKWDDFLKHRDEIREKFLKSTGLFPLPQRVPLDPHYSEPLDHPWCKVYKVAYQLWPEIYTVGLLFVPKELPQTTVPGILCPHGHFSNGYYSETVLSRCLGLARLGFVVFSTPNDHYEDFPLGISSQTHQIWRNIRGLDFLQSRSEVDPERLGACGCSGGGTQVQMLIAVDDRVKAATIAGLTCHFREIAPLTGECCACNYFPDVMRFTDQPELSALGMPCPVQYLTMNDWSRTFDQTAFPQIKALYTANGYADLVECRYEDTPHDYDRSKREWTYWWMDKHLRDGTVAEKGMEPDELYLSNLKTLKDHAVTIPGKPLPALSDVYRERDAALNLKPDIDALREMLGVDYALLPHRQEVKTLSETIQDEMIARKVVIPGEGPLGIPAIVLVKQDGPKPQLVALILDKGGTAMSPDAELPKSLVNAGYLVVIPDIRFVGSMSFDLLADGKGNRYRTFIPCDPGFANIKNDVGSAASARNAWNRNGLWWGRPLTGMSVTDINFVVDYAKKQCSDANLKEIRLVAKNSEELAVAALFTALLNRNITKLDIDLDGVSYKNGNLPFVPGILRYGDIPQWYDLLER